MELFVCYFRELDSLNVYIVSAALVAGFIAEPGFQLGFTGLLHIDGEGYRLYA